MWPLFTEPCIPKTWSCSSWTWQANTGTSSGTSSGTSLASESGSYGNGNMVILVQDGKHNTWALYWSKDINTYIHKCMHACMQTDRHTYIHTHTHEYTRTSVPMESPSLSTVRKRVEESRALLRDLKKCAADEQNEQNAQKVPCRWCKKLISSHPPGRARHENSCRRLSSSHP